MATGAQQSTPQAAPTPVPPASGTGSAWCRYLFCPAADLLRIGVRCAFPLLTLAVLALLLWSAQGHDVLRTTIERAAGDGRSISDLVFLMAGSALLSLSLWYSMRWLLSAQMPGLPLPPGPSRLRTWLPRLLGATAPALVALSLHSLDLRDEPGVSTYGSTARHWTLSFAVLSLALLGFYWQRGRLLLWLHSRGWVASTQARSGAAPGELAPHDPMPRLTLGVVVWSVACTFGIFALFVLFPVAGPRVAGTTAVAALALASINLFGSFALSYWPLRSGVPLLAPWAVLFAGLIGGYNDNHVVRPAPLGGDARPPERMLPQAALDDWLKARGHRGPAPIPVFFVASEGGGIRAAYWTAAVLTELSQRVPKWETHLFALSGVSGGSLGVASYVASRREALCAAGPGALPAAPSGPALTQALGADFLSPAVAGLMFQDLAQRFIPWPIAAFDRSRGLEGAWQRAFSHWPPQAFEHPMHALYSACPGLPRLLLNATVVETGQRALLTDLDPRDFTDTLDVMGPLSSASRQSLAGLVHHSARFPVLSPAGTLERRLTSDAPAEPWLRLVDGGYFDNSGTQTAVELIRQLMLKRPKDGVPIRPILLVVRNNGKTQMMCGAATPEQPCPPPLGVDAADSQSRAARQAVEQAAPVPRPALLFPETRAPLDALVNARGAHARLAALAARTEVQQLHGGAIVELPVTLTPDQPEAPLGWALSKSVRTMLDEQAQVLAERLKPVIARLLQTTPMVPPACAAEAADKETTCTR